MANLSAHPSLLASSFSAAPPLIPSATPVPVAMREINSVSNAIRNATNASSTDDAMLLVDNAANDVAEDLVKSLISAAGGTKEVDVDTEDDSDDEPILSKKKDAMAMMTHAAKQAGAFSKDPNFRRDSPATSATTMKRKVADLAKAEKKKQKASAKGKGKGGKAKAAAQQEVVVEEEEEEPPPPIDVLHSRPPDGTLYRCIKEYDQEKLVDGALIVYFIRKPDCGFHTAYIAKVCKESAWIKFHVDGVRISARDLISDAYMKTWAFIERAEESQE